MTDLLPMFPGVPNSPETFLTANVSVSDTNITVQSVAGFPSTQGAFLVVLGGEFSNAETVKVVSTSGNTLTVERGFQGVAQAWPTGTTAAVNFTEAHYSALVKNIKAVYESLKNIKPLQATAARLGLQVNGIYEGRDLEDVHAEEISGSFSGNVWAWIQARIRAGNYAGINVGDWIQWQSTGENSQSVISEVAGINTYTGYFQPATPNHIDFISRNVWSETMRYNPANYNNGLGFGHNVVPWFVSELRARLNGMAANVPNGVTANPQTLLVDFTRTGVWPRLPVDLRDVITNKVFAASARFTTGVLLTDCTSTTGVNVGPLWIPTEIEVFGVTANGTYGPNARSGAIQYPLFARTTAHRRKNGDWWLLSPTSGRTDVFTGVGSNGLPGETFASSSRRVPICFRIS